MTQPVKRKYVHEHHRCLIVTIVIAEQPVQAKPRVVDEEIDIALLDARLDSCELGSVAEVGRQDFGLNRMAFGQTVEPLDVASDEHHWNSTPTQLSNDR